MADWLNIETFKVRSVMPSEDIDVLESTAAGYVIARLAVHRSRIEARLRKRYAIPQTAPIPEIILDWQERLTTRDAYIKRGFSPSSEQDGEITKRADSAEAELKEAADSKDGLFDLPMRDGTDGTAVSKGGPLAYTEQSPFAWTDKQRCEGRGEDGGR